MVDLNTYTHNSSIDLVIRRVLNRFIYLSDINGSIINLKLETFQFFKIIPYKIN